MTIFLVPAILVAIALVSPASDEILQSAKDAFRKQQTDEAIRLVNDAIKEDPKSIEARMMRATFYERAGKFAEAIDDWTAVILLDKDLAQAYQERGLVQFKAGKIKESIADFDRFIERKPAAKVSHWQRGISYYYAGRYDDGCKQFKGYQDFDSNDVENAVWRFMCMARRDGIDKARKAMLKIGDDRRVPMRQVYDLFKGDLQPSDVLAAANRGEPRSALQNSQLFYAHLYVGIYHDLLGDKKKALVHLNKAANEHRIGHYMWDVARVHRDRLAQEQP